MEKVQGHKCNSTRAIASTKVGFDLAYQAACRVVLQKTRKTLAVAVLQIEILLPMVFPKIFATQPRVLPGLMRGQARYFLRRCYLNPRKLCPFRFALQNPLEQFPNSPNVLPP
jgi:hypothetical protein